MKCMARAELPAAPTRLFASDNVAGAHPLVLEALVAANEGHALAYGTDAVTQRAAGAFNSSCMAARAQMFSRLLRSCSKPNR
ncbi:MAG: hypothetical protein RLZZ332_287 [Actinomycetota bacterium]